MKERKGEQKEDEENTEKSRAVKKDGENEN